MVADTAGPALDLPPEAPAVVADTAGPALDLPPEAPAVVADTAIDLAVDGSLPVSNLTVGLVARYRLDPSSAAGVPDDSGTRNGTKSSGATWTATGFPAVQFVNGGALALDGATGYATLPVTGTPAVASEKSLSLWFWQPAATGAFRRTLVTLANPGASQGIHLGLQRGIASVWTWSQSAGDALLADAATSPGGWTHLAYTQRAGTHLLYVGGVQVDSASANYGGTATTTLLLLGAWSTSESNERWSGLIDDLRIYDRVLTATEVRALADGAP